MVQRKGISARLKTQTIITVVVVALILFFLIRFLISNWRQVAAFDFTFTYGYLILSFPILFVFFFLRVYAWQAILKKMKISLPLRKCLKVSFLSMMGKYLPGKVWTVLGKVYLSDKEGVPKAEALTSVIIEIVLEIVASIFFFFFYLFSIMEQPLLSPKVLYLLGLILVGGLVFLHPRVFYRVINTLLSKIKKETIPEAIKHSDIIPIFLFYIVIVLVQGVAFYFFVNALFYVPLQNLIGLTACLAVAGALGTLSFFAPSGLGVREGILALLLSTYIISPVAVLISLLARIWVTLVEVSCAVCAWRL
jgi:uncharacterized membrane protein YbhN (UPF0104 family)